MIAAYYTNEKLLNLLMDNIKIMAECDIEEKIHSFPYTRATNEFIKCLENEYCIDFDEDLISEKLLEKMVDEIVNALPR